MNNSNTNNNIILYPNLTTPDQITARTSAQFRQPTHDMEVILYPNLPARGQNYFNLPHKTPLYEARKIQKKTGIQIISAKDGMVINPISYSSGLRQKTLKMYK